MSRFGRRRLATALAAAIVPIVALGACSSDNAVDTSSPAAIRTSLDRATKQLGDGKIDDAEAAFAAIVEKDPNNDIARFGLGWIAQFKKDPEEAKRQYRAALESDPELTAALFNLSVLETADGDRASAIDLLRRAIAIDANDASARFNLGLLLRETGKNAAGEAELQRAVELNPALGPQAEALGFRAK